MKSAWMKLMVLASLAVAAGAATANMAQDIRIDRAVNSPTITVRYTKLKAVLAELRVNGRSLGTRELSGQADGETNFALDPEQLSEGKNDVEVLLFDADGKLVGTQKAVITAERDVQGPVFVELPQSGATVRGTVEIRLGVNRDFREVYVSFFVNDEWKSLRNFPPYSYFWDTTRLPNGWHEVQAWVVDETNTTYKTRKVRVFVNNPGGRTDRQTPAAGPQGVVDVRPAGTPANAPVGGETGLRATPAAGGTAAANRPAPAAPRTPSGLEAAGNPAVPVMADATARLRPVPSDGVPVPARPREAGAPRPAAAVSGAGVRPPLAAPSGLKPAPAAEATASGLRTLTPTGQRTAGAPTTVAPTTVAQGGRAAAPTLSAVRGAQQAAQTVMVTRGTRIPNVGNLTVLVAGRIVEFDVDPRVEQGIPLAPFRHVLEHAGGQVGWDHATKTVTAAANGRTATVQVGSAAARVGGQTVRLERPAFIELGRTILPLSFLSEAMDLQVQFDPATGHILITRKG